MTTAAGLEMVNQPTSETLARHIIEFDSKNPAGYRFSVDPDTTVAQSLAAALRPDPIPWPDGLTPTPIPYQRRPS